MGKLQEKVAFLKGMAAGLEIDPGAKDGKMLLAIIDALGEFADEIYSGAGEDDGSGKSARQAGASAKAKDKAIEFVCPNCGEPAEIDAGAVGNMDELVCKACGETIVVVSAEI